jgi:hypothetical protein
MTFNTFGGSFLAFSVCSDGVGGSSAQVSWTPSTATWYHISVVYNAAAGTALFYVNGSQQGTTQTGMETSIFNGGDALWIGRGEGKYLDGVMDELGIWSRALTSTEVTSLYNGGSGLQYPFAAAGPANLKSYNTNLKANIKTINTNPIANVKSLNTNI